MVLVFIALAFILSGVMVSADTNVTGQNVCCEKAAGLFCQDTTSDKCNNNFRQTPTACRSTSFCRLGTCYDSEKGTCTSNVPQLVCNSNNGTWAEGDLAQCSLGCCVLGDQAAFVTLVKCKKLAADLGLEPNFNSGIRDETQCVLSVMSQDKGACVYDKEFEKTCKFTTRNQCNVAAGNATFYKDKLCSAEELATNCKKTRLTTCLPGKDEVYFVDSCGNPANIYDASKADDVDYWTNVKTKAESCSPNDGNYGSKICGNCNYAQGGYCGAVTTFGTKPTYGNNMCVDLNCAKTQNGKSYKHGESWCVNNDAGNAKESSVGSRFYKHICMNGQEVLEQCADFRQEVCVEDKIKTTLGDFSQAACRVNRWQDCLGQINEKDCNNTDRRDCVWQTIDKVSYTDTAGAKISPSGICLPDSAPGLKFWGDLPSANTAPAQVLLGGATVDGQQFSDEAKQICGQATFSCVVTFEESLFGDSKCKSNCECWDESTNGPSKTWIEQNSKICKSLGDCGASVNWIGLKGYTTGYEVSSGEVPEAKSSGGGLFG